MGFYQKIRNDITDRWMGLKDLQNRQKNKYNVSLFLYLYSHASKWSEIGSSGTPHPHCFIQEHHQNHLEGCCQCNLFYSVLFRWFGNFPGCSEWIQAILSTMTVAECVLLVASTYLRRRPLALHWIKSSNSVEQDCLQQWPVYKFWFETTTHSLWYLLTHLQYLHNRLLSTTWFEDEPKACAAEDL